MILGKVGEIFQKIVRPISYDSADRHRRLWETIQAWADSVKGLNIWQERIIRLAMRGPRALSPSERSLVARLVRTTRGAKLFATGKRVPPPEWLCVFDPSCRVGQEAVDFNSQEVFDPFEVYRIEGEPDRVPGTDDELTVNLEDLFSRYENFLVWYEGDGIPSEGSGLAGHSISGWPDLPPRLIYLVKWLIKHFDKPCAAWWVARQHFLHPSCVALIEQRFRRMGDLDPKARLTWRAIIKSILNTHDTWRESLWRNFLKRIREGGWNEEMLEEFEDVMGPLLVRYPPYGINASKPPDGTWEEVDLQNVVRWDIKLPEIHHFQGKISDKLLVDIFRVAEDHLKQVSKFLDETGVTYFRTPTCYPRKDITGEEFNRDRVSYFRWFHGLMAKMQENHSQVLRAHALAWNEGDQFVFRKLKLFALSMSESFEANEVIDIILEFGQDALWDYDVRRELLFLLSKRAPDFAPRRRVKIINRLLDGPGSKNRWSAEEYRKNRVQYAAEYVRWLQNKGFPLTKKQSEKLDALIDGISDWKDEWALYVTEQYGIETVDLSARSDPGILLEVPVDEIINLVEIESRKNPFDASQAFAALVTRVHKRVLAALSLETDRGNYPKKFWGPLIAYWPEDTDRQSKQDFMREIIRLPQNAIYDLRYALGDWVGDHLEALRVSDPELTWLFFGEVIAKLSGERRKVDTDEDPSEFLRNIYNHALSAPIGKIAAEWVNGILSLKRKKGDGIPKTFKERFDHLLSIPGNDRHQVIAIIAHNLDQLYQIDPDWVEKNIMFWFNFDHEYAEPAWSGYLSRIGLPSQGTGEQMKPLLLEVFPRLYQWDWDSSPSTVAVRMIVDLSIKRQGKPDGITAKETRHCIRAMNEKNRQDVIIRLCAIGKEKDGWHKHVIPFIKRVWPQEKKYKQSLTPAWVMLLSKTGGDFRAVLECVRHLLARVEEEDDDHSDQLFARGIEGMGTLAEKEPELSLDILDTIVSDDPKLAPYELGQALNLIKAIEPELESDKRFSRLAILVE